MSQFYPTSSAHQHKKHTSGHNEKMIGLIIVTVTLFVFWWWITKDRRYPKNFPPGPRSPLPLIGDAWCLGTDSYQAFKTLVEKYGPIVGIKIGETLTVILGSFDIIQDALGREEFSARPAFTGLQEVRGTSGKDGLPGVILSSGQTWVEQRRFTLKKLRDLGLGKNSLEELVAEEVEKVCSSLQAESGKFIELRKRFNIAAVNALWKIVTSSKLDHNDPELKLLVENLDRFNYEFSQPLFLVASNKKSPTLFRIFEKLNITKFGKSVRQVLNHVSKFISYHEETYQEDVPRDFLDEYIKKIKDDEKNQVPSSFVGDVGKINMLNIMFDLLVAGSDTTGTTLTWAFLFILKHPECLRKMQEELDLACGKTRTPQWADRVNTPYTEATIHEIQRLANILFLAVPHSATRDTTFGGYNIPAGTQILPSLGHSMHDPSIFPHPREFNPERYLQKDEKTGHVKFLPHPRVIAFGVGKRRCLGETLAKMELYLFITGILHQFDIESAPGEELNTEDYFVNAILMPRPYKAKFISRVESNA